VKLMFMVSCLGNSLLDQVARRGFKILRLFEFSRGKRGLAKLEIEIKQDGMRLGSEISQAVRTEGELIQIMIQI
jgi:hypothetical protein